MSGVPSQVANRLRLLLLAVACWLCLVPTAHALRAPIPAETQLKEESALLDPSTVYVVCVVEADGRIGLFVRNAPLNRIDPIGLDDTARGMLLDELGETETHKKAKKWKQDFLDTAKTGLELLPQNDFSEAMLGESLSGDKVSGTERAAAGAGLAAGLLGKAKKCLTAAKDWWKAKKAKKAADALKGKIPKIKGHTDALRNPELVDQIKADMLEGRYRFDSPEGIIAGIEDATGTIHLTEGQHRMNAALEIFEQTGTPEFVNKLIDSARQGVDGRSFLYWFSVNVSFGVEA
jgi:hypothetical protein